MPANVRGRRWLPAVAIAAVVPAAFGCGIGLLAAWPALFPDPLTPGHRAYDRGDWAAASRSARDVLKTRGGDPAALRLLARSSVRLGRDDVAIAIYDRRIAAGTFLAEDKTLLGVAMKRRGQVDLALRYWSDALEAEPVPPAILDELTRLLYEEGSRTGTSDQTRRHPFDLAMQAADRLRRRPGWESRGELMLGIIRGASNDLPGAADSFRRVLARDPNIADDAPEPAGLRKLLARTFLRLGRPAEARPHLQAVLSHGPDPEASWILSRACLQVGDRAGARAALELAGSYRSENPLVEEPGPYVGEDRCRECHPAIFEKSLGGRHTRTYYRGSQLRALPRPDRPLPDPTDPEVTHAIREVDGALYEETRVGDGVLRSVIAYAFGTSDRYLTMVSRDAGGRYHMVRLSHYRAADGPGWDRTILDVEEPARAGDFRGPTISERDHVVRCLYCHTTFPSAGRERNGPEAADRAIGCERCHGPGGHHVAAVAAGFPDPAIVNPASASPREVTVKQCNDCHILDRNYATAVPGDPGWVRSQGAGWSWSRCNTGSGGAFGCVTCHDPHQGARAMTTAQYEAKCLSCHPAATTGVVAGPGSHACPVDPSKGCIACHMPAVRTVSSHMSLTDHYIRIPLSSKSQAGGTASNAVP